MDRSLARVMRLLEQLFEGDLADILASARLRPRRPSSRGRPRTTAGTAEDIEWHAVPPPEAPPDMRAALAGTSDPVDGRPLNAGERVAMCRRCGTGYRPSSWQFLERENGSRCLVCHALTGTLECDVPAAANAVDPVVTPVSGRAVGGETLTDIVACPSCGANNRVPFEARVLCRCARCRASLSDGSQAGAAPIALPRTEIPHHVGRIVEFQGRVVRSRVGPANERVLVFEGGVDGRGIHVVLDRDLCRRLEEAGVRLRAFGARTVRVRGLVRKHPRRGIEVVPGEVTAIRIFD